MITNEQGSTRRKPEKIKGATPKCANDHGFTRPPELPDDTPISEVEFPVRIRNVLAANGLKTVGEVRETSDAELLAFQDCSATNILCSLRSIRAG
jgi:DNA-directed RNA polymerase alpha subunit